jgi:hypothetical protein
MATWTTVAEATAITNTTLTTGDLEAANAILEIWVGVTPSLSDQLKPRDLRLLKKAEAFQAAWMQSKPALLARSDTDRVIQDTLQYDKGDRDMHVIAPIAKAAIQRLSWRSNRSLDPLTPSQAAVIRGKYTAETKGTWLDDGWTSGWSDWEDM